MIWFKVAAAPDLLTRSLADAASSDSQPKIWPWIRSPTAPGPNDFSMRGVMLTHLLIAGWLSLPSFVHIHIPVFRWSYHSWWSGWLWMVQWSPPHILGIVRCPVLLLRDCQVLASAKGFEPSSYPWRIDPCKSYAWLIHIQCKKNDGECHMTSNLSMIVWLFSRNFQCPDFAL